MTKTLLFLDTEFTGLAQNTSLISLALVADTGEEFYAEFTDYNKTQVSEWIQNNVVNKLLFNHYTIWHAQEGKTLFIKNNTDEILCELKKWLAKFQFIEIWADVLAYDWVLFCELFGGALQVPDNIFYAPFDLATAFRTKGLIEPLSKYERDMRRFEYAGIPDGRQHNALEDARVEYLCYKKLIGQI